MEFFGALHMDSDPLHPPFLNSHQIYPQPFSVSAQSSALPIALSVSGQSSAVPTAPFHFWAVISFTHSPIPFLGSYQLYPQPHSISGQSSALPTAPFHFCQSSALPTTPFHFWALISFTHNPFPFLGSRQLYHRPFSISGWSSALPTANRPSCPVWTVCAVIIVLAYILSLPTALFHFWVVIIYTHTLLTLLDSHHDWSSPTSYVVHGQSSSPLPTAYRRCRETLAPVAPGCCCWHRCLHKCATSTGSTRQGSVYTPLSWTTSETTSHRP